ncbi:M23 family metallopeptidase [Ascidiaceihabitans sp.]|uniref:M23 family metallopeptidase n=1 Tax=Ascidiaceihabitans sp. TaxID=1872644 RepID=UPI0032981FB1
MFEVDPRFQQGRKKARGRKWRRNGLRFAVFGLLPFVVIVLPLWFLTGMGAKVAGLFGGGQDDLQLVQIESDIVVAPVVPNNAFVDIAGDPTILRFDASGGTGVTRETAGPGVLDIRRFGLQQPQRLVVMRDNLVVVQRQLMTALPSTREDFAFFQAQRSQALEVMDAAMNAEPVDILANIDGDVDLGDLTDSYGASLESGVSAEEDFVQKTEVENTTSVAFVRREAFRIALFSDRVIEAKVERTLLDVLVQNGITEVDAKRLAPQITGLISGVDAPPKGSIIALRLAPLGPNTQRLLQLSYYNPQGYVGSIAQTRAGTVLIASDPWFEDNLMELAGTEEEDTGSTDGQFRLLDAVYSAAVRNGVPTTLVGEMIALMSKVHDLDKFAKTGDQFTFAYAPQHGPGGSASGQLMYAAIKGPSGDMQCYVIPDKDEGGFKCFDPNKRRPSSGGAIISPVQGILTSKFGPRKHPIHKVVRLHAGIDWAAPTGTPVYAAAPGKVSHAGDGKGYGNLIIIKHPGGLESRYAHLNKFAPKGKTGGLVQAGDLIGYVGTTGRSTGPHLHFETRLNGTPVDPMGLLNGGTPVVASGAVEALVAQIIKVESAGNANAKNPLSSATGLGQFISSTWLRMMRDYRPELHSTMSKQDLLNLRRDPTLSREMVTKLAQENESFLRKRGHNITAGRLYLSHFLGPGGAHTVLSAANDDTIARLMGAGVVKANPFLRNYSVLDLKNWADRKMRGRGKGSSVAIAAPPKPVSPEVKVYKDLVDQVLKEVG